MGARLDPLRAAGQVHFSAISSLNCGCLLSIPLLKSSCRMLVLHLAVTMARSRLVDVDAKPEPISINMGETVLLVIDMQNDFGARGGMFDLAGIDLSAIRSTIEPTAQILAMARSHGIPVIYVKEAMSADLSDAGPMHSPFGRMSKRLKMGLEITAPTGEPSQVPMDAGTPT